MWLCLIPMKLKKYICAVFPGMLAVGCKHRKPHRDQHSLMNKNCSKHSFTQTRRKHLWQLKGIMRVVSFSFSLIVLFGCSKMKITQCAMRDLDPLEAARQDQTSAIVRCPEQVSHSPSQIPRPRFPLHPALADSQPAFHGIHFQRSLAIWGGEICPFRFLCQKKRGYPQCATRLSKVKTKILWKYGL